MSTVAPVPAPAEKRSFTEHGKQKVALILSMIGSTVNFWATKQNAMTIMDPTKPESRVNIQYQ